jgi:hypothetical protein
MRYRQQATRLRSISHPVAAEGRKMPLTRVTLPTTETSPKDVPDLTSDDIPLPSDLKTELLAGLFLFAALTAAYVAAEVILPIVLAMVLTLLLQPGMRLLSRASTFHGPYPLSY